MAGNSKQNPHVHVPCRLLSTTIAEAENDIYIYIYRERYSYIIYHKIRSINLSHCYHIFSLVVCLRCLLHHIVSLIAYTFRETGILFGFQLDELKLLWWPLAVLYCTCIRASCFFLCICIVRNKFTTTTTTLLLRSLWCVQMVGYVLACRSYSFARKLNHLIIIIVQTYLKTSNL